ncbi:uncharacterized protein LOC129748410 [Uranotaenia lowii]|uniref:uncharacterized protein LOC129748410 n=1 Tax=Uranotaenia lowii TaxID=190385 RepID=UPI0024798EE7|nr:uncharacterized protein LOC129748410 [Uranotaenia lowii]XP_055598999.1 uncharacterized protein LOC129748410 [Uranotaenia lowii]
MNASSASTAAIVSSVSQTVAQNRITGITGQGPSVAPGREMLGLASSSQLAGEGYSNSKECWPLPSNHPLMAHRMSAEIISDDDDDEDEEEEEDPSRSDDDEDSCGTVSDYSTEEIPVWIKGEQRFISGVTEDTTCADLVEALLQQENVIPVGVAGGPSAVNEPKDYCITERWRQVEQILDSRTKILQIWSAWGKAQPEVKFILRRLDASNRLAVASAVGGSISQQQPPTQQTASGTLGSGPTMVGGVLTERDKDSGRGSPTGSINSAIVRRKRHRAHKTSFAWMTHGTTIHPKSSKNSIERLMKLILEQGDIIQQQLSKLRDRELQINKIEEDRHRLREREHGKNYLLETYLKGLSEASGSRGKAGGGKSELDPRTDSAGGGDSGITSEATTAASPEVEESGAERDAESPPTSSDEPTGERCVKDQIKMLEKIVLLNKQIVKEEESAVKLYDRIRRYELDIPNQSKDQLEDNLTKVNGSLEKSQQELTMIDETLKHSELVLRERTCLLKCLEDELNSSETIPALAPNVIMDFSQPNPVLSISNLNKAVDAASSLADPKVFHPHQNYPVFPISEQQQARSVALSGHQTLPRNQRFPVTAQSTVPTISVHQINKFIQSNSKLGSNCNTNLDEKPCPKQLFNSALQYYPQANSADGIPNPKPPDDDLSNMGTLV